jgi:hypothetical protein
MMIAAGPSDSRAMFFKTIVESAATWLETAKELHFGAEVIGKKHFGSLRAYARGRPPRGRSGQREMVGRSGGVFLLLAGLALENLAKSLYVLTHRPTVSDEKLPPGLKDHNIGRVLSRAKIEVTPREGEFLGKVSKAVMWSGRYPAPAGAKAIERVRVVTSLDDLSQFRVLFRRLEKEFQRRDRLAR